jgi:23S rRNA (pseudouridine1915-N3)-methyltransferase
MPLELWMIGKTKDSYVKEGFQFYFKRINRYHNLKIKYLSESKITHKTPIKLIQENQADIVMKQLKQNDRLILFDEAGIQMNSIRFSDNLRHAIENFTTMRCIFIVGGAYGFSDKLKMRANQLISLSKMTFPHQLVRLFIAEQFYRAFTIINRESYHH